MLCREAVNLTFAAVLLIVAAPAAKSPAGQDLWDVEEEVPPITEPKPALKPVLFECPNLLDITGESIERIILSIMPCPRKPVPVSFTIICETDTAVWIELFAAPPNRRHPPRFTPRTRDFLLRFIYRECPTDTAAFHVWREKDEWRVEPIRYAPFVELATARPDTLTQPAD